MKNSTLVLVALLALAGAGCKSTQVVGTTVYQRLSWPSGFGSYQHLIVAYPLGHTNLQQVVTTDSVPGPVPSMFNATVKSAGAVWAAHELRNVGRSQYEQNVSNNGSSNARGGEGGSATATGGAGGSPVSVNQTVNAPGSHHKK